VHDNHVYGPGGVAKVSGCQKQSITVSDWLKLGMDKGTTIEDIPSNQKIMEMGMAALMSPKRA
jgi:hypothetical protein